MALTQEQVDAWFDANPNATAEEVAAAVQSVGGLAANEGLASMIATRYAIAEPEVTNYYKAYTAPKVDTPTFTDTILAGTPTTEDELLTALSDNTSTVTGATGADTVVGAAGNDTIVGGTGTTQTLAVTDPFDAITAAWTNGDYAATNAIIAESGLSADDIQSYYGLDDYTMNWVLSQGIKTADNVSTVTGSTGTDTVTGVTGTDTVTGTTGTDTVTSGADTSEEDFLSTITGTTANNTVVGGTGNDTVVGAAADNITNSGLTGQAGQMVVEGDDIETQIAQLPQEYASWQTSVVPGYSDFIRKSDGVVLQRTKNNTFSDLDLLKIGLSFIPGAGPILAGLNIADAARTGNWVQAAIGATGLIPGMQNVNTALRVGDAVGSGNTFGAITALAGNTDLQNLTGLNTVNVGGFTSKDVMSAAQLGSAALAGNTAGVLTSLGALAGSSDTVLAGRALGLITRIQNGDTRALGEAISLSDSVSGGSTTTGSTGSTGSTAAAITSLSKEDLAELNPGELNAYQNGGVQGLADFRRDMRLLNSLTTSGRTGDDTGGGDLTTTTTDISGLPTGVQLASTGDGVFRTDVGGVPTYAESTNASSVTAPLGYTLLSMSESDNKPEGSYYDITANAWFKPDTAVTNLTGTDTIQADADLFNNSLGTLDQLDTTRSADEFADFLETLGITNTTQLKDSGLSNQDILDMINALDDTVVVTGGTGNDSITSATGNDLITNGSGNDNIETVSVTGAKGNDVITGVSTIGGAGGNDLIVDDKGTVTVVGKKESCPVGSVLNPTTGECEIIDDKGTVTIVDKKESCPIGTVLNAETGECEVVTESPITCPAGYELNAAGTECIPVVEIVDKKCGVGYVYDEELKKCVAITETPITCPAGYELNDAGTACIPVVTITDKKCDAGFVYDEDLKMCVPIKVDEACPVGFHKDKNGKCVPDTKDNLKCPAGYEPNEAGTECIPVVTIVDKKCPPGQVYDEELKKCVPILDDSCPEGFERDEATGKCIPVVTVVDKKCPTGQVYDEDLKKCVPITTDKCETGYEKFNGVCVPVCQEGYSRDEATGQCIPVVTIIDKKCPTGQVYDEELKKCVPIETDECAVGFHKDATGLCVPDDDEECKDGYEKVNGTCVPVCKEGYIRNLETGVCEKEEKGCPPGQTKNAEGKCVSIVKPPPPPPPPIQCPTGFKLVNGACVPISTTTPIYTPSSAAGPGEKNEPIYAGGMDAFNLLATLQELLAEEAPKKDDKKSKDKTKMATGGHLDDLLAEQMTVDDLLKLLR